MGDHQTGVPENTHDGEQPEDTPQHSPERIKIVERAIKHWKAQLIDPTRRNNLLFFRDTRTTTLRLDSVHEPARDRLIQGRPVSVDELLLPDIEDEEERDRQLADLKKRATAIFRIAQANQEEAGLETLYLGIGLATWDLGGGPRERDPSAPVLLMPMTLQPRGAGATRSFTLESAGEVVVNPVLLHDLAQHGIAVTEEALTSGVEGLADEEPGLLHPSEADEVFARLVRMAHGLENFRVLREFVLGNFQYYKMAMVADLERYLDKLIDHPIIAALAGDADARQAVVPEVVDPEPREFDLIPARDQNLILDSDSSQELVIRRVLAGQSAVIQGPPGTGKSQTIANLMAALTAEGKRVLFVAEKRAALEAVRKRLDWCGLGHLVFDLHGRGITKKQLAAHIATALQQIRNSQPDGAGELYRAHNRAKTTLVGHHDSMHGPREPTGQSIYQMRCVIQGTPEPACVTCTWTLQEITALHEARLAAHDLLDELTDYSDLVLGRTSSPWVRASVTEAGVGEQMEIAASASAAWRHAVSALSIIGLDPTPDHPFSRLEKLRTRIEKHLEAAHPYHDSLWTFALDDLARELRPGLGNVIKRLWAFAAHKPYREARTRLLAHRKTSLGPWRNIAAEAARASAAGRSWSEETDAARPPNHDLVKKAADALDSVDVKLQALGDLLPDAWTDDTHWGVVENVLHDLTGDKTTPYRMALLHSLRDRCAQESPDLTPFLDQLPALDLDSELWIQAFDHALATAAYDFSVQQDPSVQGFEGRTHDKTVSRYQEADRQLLDAAARRVVREHATHVVAVQNEFPVQAALVRREAEKKSRHLPLRKLLDEAPDVLTALFPCWLASPLSVSQLLSGETHFDVVLFDEASQVFPHDAIPSILRGRQLVIAGDRHQLPPTYFFLGTEDSEDSEDIGAVEGFESLLDQAASFLPPSHLLWHYRSRDEKLIAFSNRHVYNDTLVTFPGAGIIESPVQGLVVPHREGALESTDSGSDEVRRVVQLILEHAEQRAEESLGVIAPGQKHARRIQAQLDQQLLLRQDLDEFFDFALPERFFIKNLERVQGDERDAIIFSVGYAKDRAGNLPHRFGPITQDTGHRRLNVAVSRARQRMTVVSSFRWDKIGLKRSGSRGVEFLRNFLRYAESGGVVLSDEGEAPVPLNSFEKDIFDELTAAGLPRTPQYGCSGYRIDMVASHPHRPGRHVLAIECDGASYHSSPIARERDRIRQQVLVSLGWQFHRISGAQIGGISVRSKSSEF